MTRSSKAQDQSRQQQQRLRGRNDWLLVKKADGFAGGDDPVRDRPESVTSGLVLASTRPGRGRR